MFFIEVDSEIKLALTMPKYAQDIFKLIDSNRDFLSQWFPWVEHVKEVKDTEKFINTRLEHLLNNTALHTTIIYNNKVVGCLDFTVIDDFNKRAGIGYWLDEAHNGKAIMSRAVWKLICIGFEEYKFEKIFIDCEVINCRSCNLAKRLGFIHEGVLRKHYNINGIQKDMNFYGLLREDWDRKMI